MTQYFLFLLCFCVGIGVLKLGVYYYNKWTGNDWMNR